MSLVCTRVQRRSSCEPLTLLVRKFGWLKGGIGFEKAVERLVKLVCQFAEKDLEAR